MFRKLLSASSGRQLVIVENLLCPTEWRNSVAKALFEAPALSAGSIAFVPSHLMCTLPFNTKSALVVDVGAQETVLLPVRCFIPYPFENISIVVALSSPC